MADEELGTVPRALAVYPEILLGATPPDALDHTKNMLKWAYGGESAGPERLLILSADWIVRSLVELGEAKFARDLSAELIAAGDAVAGLREHQASRKLYVVMAELALADGDFARASDYERQATEWAMAHDHKDMLCEAARVAARIALAEARTQEAIDRLDDGILIAQSCGYVLLHIDLRNTRAQAYLMQGRAADAQADAQIALTAAIAENCRYALGEAAARSRLAEALALPAKPPTAAPDAEPVAWKTMEPPVDFVIVTPLEEERDAVLRKLKGWRKLPPRKEDIRVYFAAELPVEFSDGTKGEYKIIVVPLAEMGEQDAANATSDAVRHWRPRFVLLVGIAGGLRKAGVEIGDVLIADQVADYELQKLTDAPKIRWRVHPVNKQLLLESKNFIGDGWMNRIEVERPVAGKPKRKTGVICTGNKVIANGLAEDYKEVWDKLIGVEMEAGGVASAAFSRIEPPGFFMVRSASDLADKEKDHADTSAWREYVCDVAASYAIALLASGPSPHKWGEPPGSRGDALVAPSSTRRAADDILRR
jgi:nucleoside phosphorylase